MPLNRFRRSWCAQRGCPRHTLPALSASFMINRLSEYFFGNMYDRLKKISYTHLLSSKRPSKGNNRWMIEKTRHHNSHERKRRVSVKTILYLLKKVDFQINWTWIANTYDRNSLQLLLIFGERDWLCLRESEQKTRIRCCLQSTYVLEFCLILSHQGRVDSDFSRS